MNQNKSKWKTWHKVLLGFIGFIILLAVIAINSATPAAAPVLTQAAKDSIRLADAAASRKEKIEGAFSSWDGSHKNLEKYVKDHMNDPDSYVHVSTNYFDNGSDTLTLIMKYRGKNAFGGVVPGFAKAKALIDGTLLSVE